jgi:hypothetical protein
MSRLFVLAAVSILVMASQASAEWSFREVKTFHQTAGAPSRLKLVFELGCHESFKRIYRNDIVDSDTGEISIFIGGLVKNIGLPCMGFYEKTVDAGPLYSGRKYKIVPLSISE